MFEDELYMLAFSADSAPPLSRQHRGNGDCLYSLG